MFKFKGMLLTKAILIVKLVIITVIAVGLVWIAARSPIGSILAWTIRAVDRFGVWAPVVFGLIYAVAVVFLVPGSALTLAAGALFGIGVGTIVVTIGANAGAAAAFWIARRLGRGAVEKRIRSDPRFEAIDRAVGAEGWKIVALLRLSPVVPFVFQNYLYGLTRIGFWPCSAATLVAMLPGTFLYTYIGYLGRAGGDAAAGGVSRSKTPAEWVIIAAGLIATAIATIYVSRLAGKALRSRTGLDSTTKTADVESTLNGVI